VSRNLLAGLLSVVTVAVLAGCGSSNHASTTYSAADLQNPHPIAGNFKPDGTKLNGCNGTTGCVEQAFGNITYHQGSAAAIALVERLVNTDSVVKSDCHRIMHRIGSAALLKYGNVASAFVKGSPFCSSGYYHGLLERAFYGVSSKAGLERVAGRLCGAPAITRTTYLKYQCIHGLGHGLMIDTGYNMPLSLSICHGLQTSWDQTSCTGGVFMENINSSYGFKSPWLRKKDLVYPCDAVKKRDKLYCYLLVTSRILPATGYNWKRTARICAHVEKGWVASCFQSYGRDASGVAREGVVQTASFCRIAGRWQGECLYGAARDMANNYPAGLPRARTLCDDAPSGYQVRCFYGVGTILGSVATTSAQRRTLCREHVDRRFLQACLQGAGVT